MTELEGSSRHTNPKTTTRYLRNWGTVHGAPSFNCSLSSRSLDITLDVSVDSTTVNALTTAAVAVKVTGASAIRATLLCYEVQPGKS